MHSAEFLQEMNQKLLTMQKQFESEISAVTQKDPQHPGQLNAAYNTGAEGADTSEDDVSEKVSAYADEVSLMGELEAQLRDVQKALEAIAKGTYGICKYCNQDIDMKRLEARPSSSSCISCKKLFTQEL
jgi:RNA polymerase-binding transcription factor DksA